MKLVLLLGLIAIIASLTGCASHHHADGTHAALWKGSRIVYDSVGGSRTNIVFVHGWASSRTFWQEQMSGLQDEDTRLIAIDLVGHGDSDAPEITYTMDVFADNIAAVMNDAGVEDAILVGHSMGTPVVRQFYRRYPSRTKALILVDGGLRPLGSPEQAKQMAAPFYTDGWRDYMGQMIDMMASSMDVAWRERIKEAAISTPQHVVTGGFEAMQDESLWGTDPIKVPVLAIHANAPFWNDDYQAFVRSFIPDLTWRMWDGVSHFLFVDRPEEFNQEVRAFCNRLENDND
ncbi:MAG: alpha/beta hydrolase [Phycisphaerales bacterium]|nr:alpha/beta hydrolase [Phycisphaerales bacterium]